MDKAYNELMSKDEQQEFAFGGEQELAGAILPECGPRSSALRGAVQELAGQGLGPDVRNALVRKLRALFPELMELRGEFEAATELKNRQIRELGPFLESLRPMLEAGGASPMDGPLKAHHNLVDLSARLMWNLSETERKIETLQAREVALRERILSLVRPDLAPLVKWALAQA